MPTHLVGVLPKCATIPASAGRVENECTCPFVPILEAFPTGCRSTAPLRTTDPSADRPRTKQAMRKSSLLCMRRSAASHNERTSRMSAKARNFEQRRDATAVTVGHAHLADRSNGASPSASSATRNALCVRVHDYPGLRCMQTNSLASRRDHFFLPPKAL